MAGLVPAIHVELHARKGVDARAFASPKRLRPRRRDKPGHDGESGLRQSDGYVFCFASPAKNPVRSSVT